MEGDKQPLPLACHKLLRYQFHDLAVGRGDVETVRALWQSQRSRRLLLLRALLDETTRKPDLMGPLPSAEVVWSVIDQDARSGKRLEGIVMQPQVGSWLAYCHRRLRGNATTESPQWIYVGQLHALAVAVAMVGTDCQYRGRVPLWQGRVVLPSLGSARVGGREPYGYAEADCSDGQLVLWTPDNKVVLPDSDSPQWWPLRTIEVGTTPRLRIWLDDIDPFRDMADAVPPQRLDDVQFEHWREIVSEAWEILCADDPSRAAAIAEGVHSLVPIPTAAGWGTRSASSGDAFGSVMVSLPPDATTMAVSIVHEFQHIKLGGLMHLFALSTTDGPSQYAPWREDPRPLGGFFQGVYAFLGIAAFWRTRRLALSDVERETADFEYLYARRQTEEALSVLSKSTSLTEAGRQVTQAMITRMREWRSDDVSGRAARLVSLVVDSHRAGWRIRHLVADSPTVMALVHCWLGKASKWITAGPSVLRPDNTQGWSHGRLGLARRMLVVIDPTEAVADLAAADWASSVTQADIDLFRGDADAARAGYTRMIVADPLSPDAWTGLGLALAAEGKLGGKALLEHPALVRDAYIEVVARAADAPAPERIAAWIDDKVSDSPAF